MSTLDRALRKQLADAIGTARQIAEEAAADAIRRLGVTEDEAPAYTISGRRRMASSRNASDRPA
jgi:hypothetical protein